MGLDLVPGAFFERRDIDFVVEVTDVADEAVQKTLADNRQIVFIEDNNEAAAIAVFETGYNLFRGKYIY
ncbi:MAG: hypothetical protein ABIZ64_01475, partial [Casimicrobium sp.]